VFQKVLIANRGEIALRISRACREMGLKTVAVHSTADQDAMHVRLADESVCIGPHMPKESYLNITNIMAAAEITGADAIHPGIGFLSENVHFAEVVEAHKLVFIGPKAEHIRIMGNKIEAKAMAQKLGLPLVPGSTGTVQTLDEAQKIIDTIGFPVILKAANGGGGRGMKVVEEPEALKEAFNLTRMEAEACFGSPDIYIERYLPNPRHIEVQVLGDMHGNNLTLFERDCSIQRRHQKIWEEALAPNIDRKACDRLFQKIQKAMKHLGYYSAGTFEFLYQDGEFYFIEMNTRLQVEHPITEVITGIDLVKEQMRVAAGDPLSHKQKDIQPKGHAIECRINAENPETFIPSPAKIQNYLAPGGFNVRVDSALYKDYQIPAYYDSLVAKLIVSGETREACLANLVRALGEYVITGPETLLPLHKKLVMEPDIRSGNYTIHWLEEWLAKQQPIAA
jgi:acetyl-CoA carboxylase biotin carboxylase subunit